MSVSLGQSGNFNSSALESSVASELNTEQVTKRHQYSL